MPSKQRIPKFLLQLQSILEDSNNYSIINWNEKGNRVIINSLLQFKTDILPHYYKSKCYTSFQKQLNNYGFSSIKQNKEKAEFYHKYWTKDYKMIELIDRRRRSGEIQNQSLQQMSLLLTLISCQKQIISDMKTIYSQQAQISQNIYTIHNESQKQYEQFQTQEQQVFGYFAEQQNEQIEFIY